MKRRTEIIITGLPFLGIEVDGKPVEIPPDYKFEGFIVEQDISFPTGIDDD